VAEKKLPKAVSYFERQKPGNVNLKGSLQVRLRRRDLVEQLSVIVIYR